MAFRWITFEILLQKSGKLSFNQEVNQEAMIICGPVVMGTIVSRCRMLSPTTVRYHDLGGYYYKDCIFTEP